MIKEEGNIELSPEDDFESRKRRKRIWIILFVCILLVGAGLVIWLKIVPKETKNIDVDTKRQESLITVEEKETEDETVFTAETVAGGESKEEVVENIASGTAVAGEGEYICEFSEIRLPGSLKQGDFADVRLSLADGRNFTVISAKQIMDFDRTDGKELVRLPLCEEEIIIMDSAISDTKLFDDSKLYLVIGNEAIPNKINYPVNLGSEKLLRPAKGEVDNLSGYNYEVKFNKDLEKERYDLKIRKGLKAEEWKEAATYWNEKE